MSILLQCAAKCISRTICTIPPFLDILEHPNGDATGISNLWIHRNIPDEFRYLMELKMKQEILAATLILLVVGSLSVGYFTGSLMNVRTTTTTTSLSATVTATRTMTTTQTVTTTLSQGPPPGISLQVVVNGTTMAKGDEMAITATLFNSPIGQDNSIAPSYNWPIYGLLMFNQNFPPCQLYSPFELVVLKGNYTSDQLMAMGPPGTPSYMCAETTNIIAFTFYPNSASTRVTGLYDVTDSISTYGPINASVTLATNGYWDNSSSLAYPVEYSGLGDYSFLSAQHPFIQGVYTVAVADEWGQLDIIHITVE